MRLLLDTQVLIALIEQRPDRLGRQIEAVLSARESAFSASVASLWKIAIKTRLGKLGLNVAIDLLLELIAAMRFDLLPILARHVLAKAEPEPPTRDPFDQLSLRNARWRACALSRSTARWRRIRWLLRRIDRNTRRSCAPRPRRPQCAVGSKTGEDTAMTGFTRSCTLPRRSPWHSSPIGVR